LLYLGLPSRGIMPPMTDEEIKVAAELYGKGLTLAEVRKALRERGFRSRSINTLRVKLPAAGCQMRQPGRRAGHPARRRA